MSRRPPEATLSLRRFLASRTSPGGFASVRDEPCRSPRPSVSFLWFRRSRPSDSGRSWSASRLTGPGLERAEAPPGPDGERPRSDGHQGEEAVVGIFPGQSSLEQREVASTRMTTVPRAGQAAIDNDGTVLCLKAGDVDV